MVHAPPFPPSLLLRSSLSSTCKTSGAGRAQLSTLRLGLFAQPEQVQVNSCGLASGVALKLGSWHRTGALWDSTGALRNGTDASGAVGRGWV